MSPNVWKGFKAPPAAFDQSLAALKRNSVTGTKTASCTARQSQPKGAGRRSEPTLPRHRGQGDGRQGTVSKGAELFLITCCSVILSLALCNCMWVVSILHPSFPRQGYWARECEVTYFQTGWGQASTGEWDNHVRLGWKAHISPNDASPQRQGFSLH